MTKGEAIYRLKNMAWLYGSAEREQNIEAIDMAIEALHREEAEEKGYCHRIKPKEHLKNDAIQGEWIGLSECSLCGKQAYDFIEGCVEGVEYLPNYCPNCGAKMFPSAELTLQTPQTYGKSINPSNAEERASVQRYIDSISTEAVKVVRCKDCRHRYEEGDNTHYYWCRLNDRPIDDTDYCAWGERREP